MAIVPSTTYTSNVVDIPTLIGLFGTDWPNQAVAMKSGAVMLDTRPIPNTSQVINVRNQIFETEEDGQAIGIDGELNFKEQIQTSIYAPVVVRADAANIYTLQGEIQAGGPIDEAAIAEQMRAKAAIMIDTAVVRAIEGIGAAITGNAYGDGSTITLDLLNSARWNRGDFGNAFQDGIILWRSEMMAKAMSLGLVAATSNTWGADAQNQIALRGTVPTVQGLYPFVSNKLALSGADQLAYLIEKNSVLLRANLEPVVEIAPIEKGFGHRVKFYIRMAIGFRGVGWSGAVSDIVTNDDLAASGNWALKAAQTKHVPIVRWLTDND